MTFDPTYATIRPFANDDARSLVALSTNCVRGEADFVLNPLWESTDELFSEFARFGIDPAEHLLVAESEDGVVCGMVGFVRRPADEAAGFFCPIVARNVRGNGLGGELLRSAQEHGREKLGIRLATAAIGTRNHAGYSLLSSHGFRPVRQHFLLRCNQSPGASEADLTGIEFAPATEADSDDMLALYTECGFEPRSRDDMRAIVNDGRHAHSVARDDARQLVAFVELDTHWTRRVWVAYVGVPAAQRDRGIGSSLVSWALAKRFESGATSALLLLSPANRTALRAYEKVGFHRYRLVDVLEKAL